MAERIEVIIDGNSVPFVRAADQAGGAATRLGRTMQTSSRPASAFSSVLAQQQRNLHDVSRAAKITGVAIGVGLALEFRHAIQVAVEFEQQMARVQAVTGATEAEMGKLREQAKQLGAETKYSAQEAAGAMYELSSAGFSVVETQKALPGVLDLAASSNMELADAAEISSNALRGFKMEADESGHVADIMAAAVNKSSLELTDLQLSMKYIGPVAVSTGQDLEQMTAALSIMGDAGIKGEQGGTTLRAGLLRLVKPTNQVIDGLRELGLRSKDVTGPDGLLPLPELIGRLRDGMEGLSKAEQAHALAGIFGQEAMSGMFTLVDAGPEKLEALARAYERSDGAAKKAAETMNDTVSGAWDELRGSIDTVEISLLEHFSEPLKNALHDATDLVNTEGKALQDFFDELAANPAFKNADMAGKLSIAIDEFRASDVGDEIRDVLDDVQFGELLGEAISEATPAIVKATVTVAGHAAEGFATAFINSDAWGKLVLGAILVKRLGIGPLLWRGIGTSAATATAAGLSAGTPTVVAAAEAQGVAAGRAYIAGMRTQTTAGGLLIPTGGGIGKGGPIPTPVGGWRGRAGSMGAGALRFGGAGLALGGAMGFAADDSGLGLEGRIQNAISSASFGLLSETTDASQSEDLEEQTKKIDGYFEAYRSGAMTAAEAVKMLNAEQGWAENGTTADLTDLNDEQIASLKAGAEEYANAIASIENSSGVMRSGLLSNMRDIDKQIGKSMRTIEETVGTRSKAGREALSENFRAAAHNIAVAMGRGEIGTKRGMARIEELIRQADLTEGLHPNKFGKAFAEMMAQGRHFSKKGLNDIIADFRQMPEEQREIAADAMQKQLREYVRGGQLSRAEFRDIRSKIVTELDVMTEKGIDKSQELNRGMSAAFAGLDNTVGISLESIAAKTNAVLGELGAKKISFSAGVAAGPPSDPNGSAGGGRPQGRQRGGYLPGARDGDRNPAMLEDGEYVLNKKLVAAIGPANLDALNFGAVSRFQTGGLVGKPVLQGPAGIMRDGGQGSIDTVWDAAQALVKKKQAEAAAAAAAAGGVGGYTGPPADFKQLGNNAYVDSHTLAVTAFLAGKFGLTMSSGYRSPAYQMQINPAAPNSFHTHGTPSNPGATDSVGSMGAMNAYIAYARSHVAGLQEAMVDNVGHGWNAHLAFFQEGGLVGLAEGRIDKQRGRLKQGNEREREIDKAIDKLRYRLYDAKPKQREDIHDQIDKLLDQRQQLKRRQRHRDAMLTAAIQLRTGAREQQGYNRHGNLLDGALGPVFGDFMSEMGLPYLGSRAYGTAGRRVGRDGYALVHRDEQIVPDPQGPAGTVTSAGPAEVRLVLVENPGAVARIARAEVNGKKAEIVREVDRTIGRRQRQLAGAPGR